jgi:hypothetical protein
MTGGGGPRRGGAGPRTFLLGVGAQKAGTTWLYEYLRDHPQCRMGPVKELGVFHARFRPDLFPRATEVKLDRLQAALDRQRARAREGRPHDGARAFLAQLDSLALEFDLDRYMPYFDALAARAPGTRLVGDITPEYSALTAEELADIRRRAEAAGYRIRVVFLMRDPVERCFSAIRMGERNTRQKGGRAGRPAHRRLAREACQDWCAVRTRYERTIGALETVFAPEEIFYGFYESFISKPEVARFCDFAGIDRHPPQLDRRANASPRAAEPDPGDIATVREFYDETYRFCAERFGPGLIGSLWPHA